MEEYEPYCKHCTIENPLSKCADCDPKITKDTSVTTHEFGGSRIHTQFVTVVGEIRISTVLLGGYVPTTYETMVFDTEDNALDMYTDRMFSQFDAMVSHIETVRRFL